MVVTPPHISCSIEALSLGSRDCPLCQVQGRASEPRASVQPCPAEPTGDGATGFSEQEPKPETGMGETDVLECDENKRDGVCG